MKGLDSGQRISDTNRRQSQTKSRGENLSEKPPQAKPTKSNKQAKEATAEKGRWGKKNGRELAERKKTERGREEAPGLWHQVNN